MAGDIALVIAGGFMGRVVELQRLVTPGEIVSSPTGKLYQFRPVLGIEAWLCQCGSELVMKHEKNLMPLQGETDSRQFIYGTEVRT